MKLRTLIAAAIIGGAAGGFIGSLVLPVPAAVAGPGQVSRYEATEPGQCQTVAQTAENALDRKDSRNVWCLYANDGNTDELRFKLGATATTASGFVLNAGQSFCDPVGDNSAFTGRVSVIAESGTQTYCTLAY